MKLKHFVLIQTNKYKATKMNKTTLLYCQVLHKDMAVAIELPMDL